MTDDLDPRKNTDMKTAPRVLNREVFYKGDQILEQDHLGNQAYFIEKGRVEVRIREGRHSITVSELGPGEIFGEMALIGNESRSADIEALEDTTVTIISHTALENKISAIEDKAIRALFKLLISRLREANKGQIKHYKNFAEFQERVVGIMEKVETGIAEDRRTQFQNDVLPLLDRLEALLTEYQK